MANQEQKPKKNLSPSVSTARKIDSLGYDSGCEYGGQMYSHGSIVAQAGTRMKCDNGNWVAAKKAVPVKLVTVANKGTK